MNFEAWRSEARDLILKNVRPGESAWIDEHEQNLDFAV
jgi:hypothetical protein